MQNELCLLALCYVQCAKGNMVKVHLKCTVLLALWKECCALARTVFDQLLIWVKAKKPVVQIGLGSPKTKFQSYRPINDSLPSIFVFGSIIMVKELLAELKFAIFKNWLDTRPKMETHEPRVYPTILGGVSRGFWSPFEDLGARSAIFWHLKTGTFAKIWLDFDSQ